MDTSSSVEDLIKMNWERCYNTLKMNYRSNYFTTQIHRTDYGVSILFDLVLFLGLDWPNVYTHERVTWYCRETDKNMTFWSLTDSYGWFSASNPFTKSGWSHGQDWDFLVWTEGSGPRMILSSFVGALGESSNRHGTFLVLEFRLRSEERHYTGNRCFSGCDHITLSSMSEIGVNKTKSQRTKKGQIESQDEVDE